MSGLPSTYADMPRNAPVITEQASAVRVILLILSYLCAPMFWLTKETSAWLKAFIAT